MSVSKQIHALRKKYTPTWAQLRSIGNSRAVQASALFPAVGYLILLSDQVTNFFDGGLVSGASRQAGVWDQLWSFKLYFVYFGLLSLGLGSALYQWRCPRQIKKHGDWEDYVRIDGPAMTAGRIQSIEQILKVHYQIPPPGGPHGDIRLKNVLNAYYAALSTDEWFVRLLVAVHFVGGFCLLSIPSAMTVLKIIGMAARF